MLAKTAVLCVVVLIAVVSSVPVKPSQGNKRIQFKNNHVYENTISRGIPASFDCKMRHLVMDYARKIQNYRSKSTFDYLASVLNLHGGNPGGASQCWNVTYDGPDQEFNPRFPVSAAIPIVYVDTANGNDKNDGQSLQHAVKTAARGIAVARGLKKDTGSYNVGVVFRKGVYYLSEALELDVSDNGLMLQSYEGEEVWFSGGIDISSAKWTKYSGKKHVYMADLKEYSHLLAKNEVSGLRINRNRAVRARYPNGCTSTQQPLPSGYLCMGSQGDDGSVVNPNDGFGSNLLTEWVFPEKPTMHQANWTEYLPGYPERLTGSSFQNYQLGIGGTCSQFVPAAGYWCGSACSGGAPQPPDCIARWPKGLVYNSSVLPHGPYEHPEDAVVQVWHPGHWSSWMFEVDAASSNSSHLMFGRGGFQDSRGGYPDVMGEAFFIEGVFEELDANNEFYYDKRSNILYYFSTNGAPEGLVEITNLKNLVTVKGSIKAPVMDVSLLGLRFQDTALSYLDDHTAPSGGDWGLGLVAAIFATGVENLVIDSCVFEKLDGNAILVKGYARNTVIQRNDLHEIGDNMIALLGETKAKDVGVDTFGWDGTDGTQPRGSIIKENIAYRCGLFEKQSSFFFQAKSCNNQLIDNIFFHGPRAGINFNDGFGGGNLLQGNLMFATVMETGDHGPFNSWDRQPYAHEYDPQGYPNVIKKVDEIRNNFFVGNYYGQESVDNDDGSNYFNTHHNFFPYAEIGMKNDFDGHDNTHHHNVYAFIQRGVGICGALPGHEDHFYENKVIQLSNTEYADYDCSCTDDSSCPSFYNNTVFTPDASMLNICGQTLAQRQAKGIDLGTHVQTWPTDDEIIQWGKELLGL